MSKTYTVYYHTFPNGKMYFGQTCKLVEKRWGKDGSGYKSQPLMWRAIEKYGWNNIEHRIISTGLDKDEADFQEMFYISAYRTNEREFGYNMTNGGDGYSGYDISDETRHKMSLSRKGKKKSEEWKRKISESHKGLKLSEETINKIKETKQKNPYKCSEETRIKLSEVGKGRVVSEEARRKSSETQKGRPQPKYKWLTPNGEIKEMGIAQVGRHHPDWKLINDDINYSEKGDEDYE